MTMESKVYLLGNSCARSGNHFQASSQLSFAYATSGQNLWQSKDLPSLLARRGDTKLRAERVTRRPPQEGSDREEYKGVEGTNILNDLDANAESFRRRKPKRTSYSRPEIDEEPPPSMRERNNRDENGTWAFERNNRAENSRWDFERNNRDDNSEWDYESEAPRAERQSSKGWQWWAADMGDDTYEEEDEEDYEEEDNWLSWLSADVKDVFMLLRWGLPAAFLLCTAVIPVMIGNPLILLFGFTIFPTVVKFLNPFAKDIFRSVANPSGSSPSTRSKTRSQRASKFSRRGDDRESYADVASPSQPISRGYGSDVPRQNVTSQTRNLGGWDDLEIDRSRARAESQWPLQRRGKSGKKLAKREQPLVIRIILAFFPFLRGFF